MPADLADGRPIRWGVIGAGSIADTVCQDLGRTAGNELAVVAARDPDRARRFAARHGARRGHGGPDGYRRLVADDEVDIVYVATTHPHHLAPALLAIEAGKPVLVEKPIGLNAGQAHAVYEAADRAGVFAMEAMWMRTNPLIRHAAALAADGVIGEVRGVRFEFGLGEPLQPAHRVYDLANGGGALLDLGIYPVTFALLFLGVPDVVQTVGALASTGADDTVAMQWLYAGQPRAQLFSSLSAVAPNTAAVYGSTGCLEFGADAMRPTSLTVRTRDGEYVVADPIAGQGFGYGPQLEEVARCLRAGLLESPLVPRADSLAVLRILDAARRELGVGYPTEAD